MIQRALTEKKKRKVPDYLIYEIMDGQPIYYRGYKDVLNKTKTLAEIMGCSSLQFVIIDYLLSLLFTSVDRSKFLIATNEAGVHISPKNNLSTDIGIFDWSVLTPEKVSKKYADVPPTLAIEIDIDAEISVEETGYTIPEYVRIKIQKLLEFGVQKVVWIFSTGQKVIIAEQGKDWSTKDWNQTIRLFGEVRFNIGRYLTEKGVSLENE